MSNNPSQAESINICGILVHAHPDNTEQVRHRLMQLDGVEIHEVTADGRLVVTVELPDHYAMADTINLINGTEGVISAAMVYQHHE